MIYIHFTEMESKKLVMESKVYNSDLGQFASHS